jgi:hypothetical protein
VKPLKPVLPGDIRSGGLKTNVRVSASRILGILPTGSVGCDNKVLMSILGAGDNPERTSDDTTQLGLADSPTS